MTNDRVHRTREMLLQSQAFNTALEEFSAVQVGRAPPMAIESWSWETHREVRQWANGHAARMPRPIADYLEAIRKRIPPAG